MFFKKNFYKKIDETLFGDNVGKDYLVWSSFWFSDFEDALTYPYSKTLINFSSLLLWKTLLKMFYLLVLPNLYLCGIVEFPCLEILANSFFKILQYGIPLYINY